VTEDLAELDALLADLARRLTAPERRKLGQDLADQLRRSNADRIGRNVTPTGEAMVARKKRLRENVTPGERIKSGRMFLRARSPRFLRKQASASEAVVRFAGSAARIMRVHQFGEIDAVDRKPGAPRVQYPARELLGYSEADRQMILDVVLRHLGT